MRTIAFLLIVLSVTGFWAAVAYLPLDGHACRMAQHDRDAFQADRFLATIAR